MGLQSIKEQNGIAGLQDPSTAKFDDMPQSTVNAVIVDILAPANLLPEKLITFFKHRPAIMQNDEIDDKIKC